MASHVLGCFWANSKGGVGLGKIQIISLFVLFQSTHFEGSKFQPYTSNEQPPWLLADVCGISWIYLGKAFAKQSAEVRSSVTRAASQIGPGIWAKSRFSTRKAYINTVCCFLCMQLLGFLCFIKAFAQVLAFRIQDSQRCFHVKILTECCQRERS